MGEAIDLRQLQYPNEEVRQQIMSGDWPELSRHQWAILVGHPMPFMAWDVEVVTREDYERAKVRAHDKQP